MEDDYLLDTPEDIAGDDDYETPEEADSGPFYDTQSNLQSGKTDDNSIGTQPGDSDVRAGLHEQPHNEDENKVLDIEKAESKGFDIPTEIVDAVEKGLDIPQQITDTVEHDGFNIPEDAEKKTGFNVEPILTFGSTEVKTQQGPPQITERQRRVREAMKVGQRARQPFHPLLTRSLAHSLNKFAHRGLD